MEQKYTPLSEKQVASISLRYYSNIENKAEKQEKPCIVLVGAQPGAGKSQAAKLAKSELRQSGGYIHVDADRMREYIPTRGAKPSSQQTQEDAGKLVANLRNLAITARRNIIEEGTFRNPDGAIAFIKDKQAKGYQVELLAVATPKEQSLLGIYMRHEMQHLEKAPNPRMVPDKYHDEAMAGFSSTLAKAGQLLDRARVIDREGRTLFDSQAQNNRHANALEALVAGQRIGDRQISEAIQDWQEVKQMAENRGASTEYLASISGHQEHLEELKKNRIHGYAIQQVDANIDALASDSRFSRHTDAELVRAAYFRGFHEKSVQFEGREADFQRYDTMMSDRKMLDQLPDIVELQGRHVARSQGQTRENDGLSL